MLIPNPAFQVMPIDETSLVIFDPDSGNSHILDETGMEIYRLCDGTRSTDDIILQLTQKYNEYAEDVRNDVVEFVEELLSKKIVLQENIPDNIEQDKGNETSL